MEENADATSTDSSSAPAEATDPSQATTQPVAAAPAQPELPFHQHPRFRELTTANRDMKQQIAQMAQALQQFQQKQQQSQNPQDGPLTQEEEAAAKALRRIMSKDPELAAALMAGKHHPQVQQTLQGLNQMQQQAIQAHNNAAKSYIKELATGANLPTDKDSLDHIVLLVSRAGLQIENGDERYKSGDMSVLEEAFQKVSPWLNQLRKPAETNLVNTKNKLKTLPKPAQGSAAGQPALPKLDRSKGLRGEREYEGSLATLAKRMLESEG